MYDTYEIRWVRGTVNRTGIMVAEISSAPIELVHTSSAGADSLAARESTPSSPQLVVEHPIVRVDTNDRVQYLPHVLRDVGLRGLAETVYRGMATGQRWGGRGWSRLRDPQSFRLFEPGRLSAGFGDPIGGRVRGRA